MAQRIDVKLEQDRVRESLQSMADVVDSLSRKRQSLNSHRDWLERKVDGLRYQLSDPFLRNPSMLADLSAELDAVVKELRACDYPAEYTALKEQLGFLNELGAVGCRTLVHVEDLSAWPGNVQVIPGRTVSAGPVERCGVRVCEGAEPLTVSLANSDRYDPAARPIGLDWVPGYSSDPTQETACDWTSDELWCIHNRVIVLPHPVEASKRWMGAFEATDRRRVAQAEIEKAGGTLDLKAHYTPESLLGRIKAEILSQTVSRSRFLKSDAARDLRRPTASFQADWDVLVGAPWAKSLSHASAKLKYTLESKERPRFWHEETDGHFGFRLRTRDHTWLVGDVFVDPFLAAATESTPIQVFRHDQLLHGRLHIKVREERDGPSPDRFGL